VNEALRLSPRDNRAWLWMHFSGAAKIQLGADEDAIKWFRRAIELNPNFPLMHFFLAAALASQGKPEEARVETKAALAIDPAFTIQRFRLGGPESDNTIFVRQRERLSDMMRKAGVPEG
jgi:tetratricopeptide (TPR) repeat protein